MICLLSCWLAMSATSSADSPEEHFERAVRPLLASRCYRCHDLGNESKGELVLSSAEGVAKGGSRGPLFVKGEPSQSLMMEAVRRAGELKMPPDAALSTREVADLERWIKEGAVWPRGMHPRSTDELPWAFRPIREFAMPAVRNPDWPRTYIDAFLLSRLESEGIDPAPSADRLVWRRRVNFDLIGLPPEPEESRAFLEDDRPDAEERVIDRLLASPHYGERWARHWLDLVRYAETNGHEEDTIKANAFRYRDYVIDAFNRDLPYDVFMREQIAGDLLQSPRIGSDGRRIESPAGSGFLWLGEMMHLPFSVEELRLVEANEIEGQVDTYGKAFLGLTLACARCHDHKFDPVLQSDYYAVGGAIASTTNTQLCIETPTVFGSIEKQRKQVESLDAEITSILHSPEALAYARRIRRENADQVAECILAVARYTRGEPINKSDNLSGEQLQAWGLLMGVGRIRHPLFFPFGRLLSEPKDLFARRSASVASWFKEMNASQPSWSNAEVLGDFEELSFKNWKATGHAFGDGPVRRRDYNMPGVIGQGFAHSGRAGTKLTGRLVSPRFVVDKSRRHLCFFIAGGDYFRKTCVNLIQHSQAMPQNPPFWTIEAERNDYFTFKTIDLGFYDKFEVFLEVVDDHQGDYGWIAVDHFYFSENRPAADHLFVNELVIDALHGCRTLEEFAGRYERLVKEALDREESNRGDENDLHWNQLIDWLCGPQSPLLPENDLVESLPPIPKDRLIALKKERDRLAENLPASEIALVSQDRAKVGDIRKQNSADPADLGEAVPRGRPFARWGYGSPTVAGSGRLDLAEWTASPQNPLPARVIVNRLWKHHFGRGLVVTPDNFGAMGEPPTHPELLDTLAVRLIESAWSIKEMHRAMVSSAAYRQASQARSESFEERDPQNSLLHRMPIRRLEAESIRDAILSATNNLDLRRTDGSVKLNVPNIHMIDPVVTPGIKETERQRSIYIQIMRNHVPTLMDAFNYPQMSATVGARMDSSVPKQALEMLNGEFAWTLAREWAERMLNENGSEADRITEMHWAALGRPPLAEDLRTAHEFLKDQIQSYVRAGHEKDAEIRAWADWCHVMLNLSEFIVVR